MENKKLLNFLLKDLNELDELFEEKGSNSFDSMEMEFLQSRLKSSKKLVQILAERENLTQNESAEKVIPLKSSYIDATKAEEEHLDEMSEDKEKEMIDVEIKEEKIVAEIISEETADNDGKFIEEVVQVVQAESRIIIENGDSEDMEMEEEGKAENINKTLGDSFLKEKSVNDLIAGDIGKLEHKLSNRPVQSIYAAIGINDRFQYIRELFNGNPEVFVKTVSDIDTMKDLKEAVSYLQQNFKWKKTETSLKFVNLVKRRFPHD